MKFKSSTAGILGLWLAGVEAWWQPEVASTWQIVLSQPLKNTSINVGIFDFDVFDNPASTITSLHKSDRKAICYFSAGSWERWRSDAKEFKKADLGKPLDGWPGERWLNTRSQNVRKIMQQRMDMAKRKGCDAIDPDNVDVYDNGGGGFGLTKADAIDYVKFLAAEGHKRGMAVGLKNAGGIISSVLSDVDFQVNEQCVQYNECNTFRPFIKANKPVFHIEYVKGEPTSAKVNKICSSPSTADFSTVIKHLNLDEWVVFCPGSGESSTRSHKSNNPATTPAPSTQKANNPAKHNGATSNIYISSLHMSVAIFVGLFLMQ